MGKLIRALFFQQIRNLQRNSWTTGGKMHVFSSMRPIKQKLYDKFKIFIKYNIPCFKNLEYTDQSIIERGETMVQNELNFFTLLETLMKIKATLAVMV